MEVRYPPLKKGYLSDTCAIPYENKANGCDTPLCDTISKGYCAIWGSISHWAAKQIERFSRVIRREQLHFNCKNIFIWKIVSRKLHYICIRLLLRELHGKMFWDLLLEKSHCLGVPSWSLFFVKNDCDFEASSLGSSVFRGTFRPI